MSFTIRQAGPGDLEAVVALDRAVRNDPAQPAHASDWLDPDPAAHIGGWIAAGQCHVALIADRIVGYGVLHHHFFHDGFVDMLIVETESRRLGIGSGLVRHMTGYCRSEKLWISTNLSNRPMQAMLARDGFKMSGFIEGLDDGDPELIYHKVIRPNPA